MTAQTETTLPPTGFLRLREVLKLIPVSRSAWYAGVKEGRYPAPIPLGPKTAVYRVEDIRALIERHVGGSDPQMEGE